MSSYQEVLYWENEVFETPAVAPLDLPVTFSKASVVVQDASVERELEQN